MKINPPDHRPIDSTLRCICGRTWEVTIIFNGDKKVMEAHSSGQSLRAALLGGPYMSERWLVYNVSWDKRTRGDWFNGRVPGAPGEGFYIDGDVSIDDDTYILEDGDRFSMEIDATSKPVRLLGYYGSEPEF